MNYFVSNRCSGPTALAKIKQGLSTVLIGLFLLLGATPADATAVRAKIEAILLYEDGDLVYIYPVGGVPNPPSCHGTNGNYLSFKMNRPRAREYLSALLAAQASNRDVTLYHANACVDQTVSVTLRYLTVH